MLMLTLPRALSYSGRITFGDSTVVHPQAVIHCIDGGEIQFGSECIIEELVQIVHTGLGKMVIGDKNLFEAGCRECFLCHS